MRENYHRNVHRYPVQYDHLPKSAETCQTRRSRNGHKTVSIWLTIKHIPQKIRNAGQSAMQSWLQILHMFIVRARLHHSERSSAPVSTPLPIGQDWMWDIDAQVWLPVARNIWLWENATQPRRDVRGGTTQRGGGSDNRCSCHGRKAAIGMSAGNESFEHNKVFGL